MLTLLWTDKLIALLVITVIAAFLLIRRREHLCKPWYKVGQQRLSMVALVIVLSFVGIGLLDSMHFRLALEQTPSAAATNNTYYSAHITSALDWLIKPLGVAHEKTYSAPFALPINAEGNIKTVMLSTGLTALKALAIWLAISILVIFRLARKQKTRFSAQFKDVLAGKTTIAWREVLLTAGIMLLLTLITIKLSSFYHILGTDKIGQDVFYETLKSVRTALVIGTITTLFVLPFAIFLGISAGYFGGRIDDLIQYIYTTLSAVPSVLLISAAVLSLDVFISNHAADFPTIAQRADAKLLALCMILGITSWTPLCRLLRGETFKLREMDFVDAAVVLGVNKFRIITRHILPNVMHIVLITTVLDFSALVLAEAVLSYVGVGVDPTTMSWGNMINAARLELAREPVVWWPLFAAFIMMFTLILATNLFADAVRNAFDPKLRDTIA